MTEIISLARIGPQYQDEEETDRIRINKTMLRDKGAGRAQFTHIQINKLELLPVRLTQSNKFAFSVIFQYKINHLFSHYNTGTTVKLF